MKKTGKSGVNFEVQVGFWVKNEGGGVSLWGLGKMGKKKVVKNVRKTFENVRKLYRNV